MAFFGPDFIAVISYNSVPDTSLQKKPKERTQKLIPVKEYLKTLKGRNYVSIKLLSTEKCFS
ncbi:MAG: hypothetical protein HY514_03715 [Candidatus Aenigmarchaeota archaeon]|nr:hypothetical protein [Candidatus Aenigmarchaeota archaeon]